MNKKNRPLISLRSSPAPSNISRKLTRLVQRLANLAVPRGFPRLVWVFRALVIGGGIRDISYLDRFRMYCDSSSYPSVMAASGFVYTRMDRILKIILKPQMVFLDVGANVGFVSLLACTTLRGIEGKVYAHCFEPDPTVFEWLSGNRQLNSNLEMVTNPIAVGAHEGHGALTVSARSGWSTMVEEPPEGFSFLPKAGQVKVPITTLDKYCRDHALSPGLIKIDVEGFEKDVLIGARETLQQCRPFILIELNPLRLVAAGTSGEEIIADLVDLGYVLFHVDLSAKKLPQTKKRKRWRELSEVMPDDLVEGADFDALAVPEESVT